MVKAVFEQFEMYHKLYYNFKNEEVIKAYDRCFDLFKDFPTMKFKSGKNEEEIVYHLRKISEYTYTLIELRIEMEYCTNGEGKKVLA